MERGARPSRFVGRGVLRALFGALGFDRLVALICGEDSIRDVIAFPKTQTGQDLMTGAPGPVDASQLEELHVRINMPEEVVG